MALIGMRTRNAQDAARLSGMLQTVGYIIAALGPVLIGSLLDLSGSWTLPLAAMLAGVVFCGVMGQLAGRPGVVE
jgi:CP family cyanate transporter-like MFS transporter